jgi:hypothetical protein
VSLIFVRHFTWEIKITDENDNLISICKLTNMDFTKKKRE